MTPRISHALGVVLALAALPGCGTARRGPPEGPEPTFATREASAGRWLFFEHCNPCHPGGEAGLGPALNNKPIPDAAVRLMVREGFGAMPSFSHDTLADKQLDAIVSYLDELRHEPHG